uniref:Translocase of chloroplast 159/132 membrane anchor domain-containing protein n=1 Tax=Araucaria cunninghamii TaxID=56994 RepID=A0A0D6QRH9_ARACU
MKKQWKEELRRRRDMKNKKMEKTYNEDADDENPFDELENPNNEAEPVVMPDMVLPPSFDSENPIYRYRYWDSADRLLVRPVLDTHGWDHDVGYDGVNVEKTLIIGDKVPASISGQITKDKKEANLQLECAASLKHGEHSSTLAGFDVQTLGKSLAYTLRSETRFSNFKRNKTAGGLSLSYLGNTLAGGMKLEDTLMVGKRLKFVVNGGAMVGGRDVAYGGSLEATLRDKDYPIGQTLTTFGLSVMNWHGDLAIGGNLQSQFAVGRKTTMVTRANLNNRGSGQISIRTSSSDQLQIALIGLIPLMRSILSGRLFGPPYSTQ